MPFADTERGGTFGSGTGQLDHRLPPWKGTHLDHLPADRTDARTKRFDVASFDRKAGGK